MIIKEIPLFFVKLFQLKRMVLFFLLNRFRYQRLEFRSLIIKPVEIVGRKYITLCEGVTIRKYSSLYAIKVDKNEPALEIGAGSSLGYFNHIAAVKRVVLGKYVLTANNVYISDNLHEFGDINVPVMYQPVIFKAEVDIGDGSWIGENACIIGAKIGKNCVVGANSVVTRDIPDYCVAAGAPARVIRRYNPCTKKWEKTDPEKGSL